MRITLAGFFRQQLFLTLATYIVGYFFFQFLFEPYFFPFLLFLPVLFLAINTGFYYTIIRHSDAPIRSFTSRFIMFFGIKMMVLLIFILVYALFNPQNAVSFLITFFALYLINTVFVIFKVVKVFKK